MKILVVGPQGSGKSTLGRLLAEKLAVPFINMGKLLREITSYHPHFHIINEAMSRGLLVPFEYGAEIVRDRINQEGCANGFVLDGWGRNIESLEFFDPEIDVLLYLDVSRATSINRLTGRRVCEDGRICNIYAEESSDLSCSKCSGKLTIRPDDNKEAVEKRLDIFYKDTLLVVNYYKSKSKIVEIDAEPLPEVILASTLLALEKYYDKNKN